MRIIGIRRSIIQLVAAVLGISIFLGGIWSLIHHVGESRPVYVQYHARPQIIIDAGHGGLDGGAVGINNVVEKEINLGISLKLADLLRLNGFDVILTRSDDNSIHDPEESSPTRQKRSDMYNRRDIMEAHPNAIFISIHQNKFSDPSCKGAQVFYSINHQDSEALAQTIQDQFREKLQQDNNRQIKIADEGLFLLYNAKIPAVMVECGFLSNQLDCDNLCDTQYQKKVAFVIYLSLIDFYNR